MNCFRKNHTTYTTEKDGVHFISSFEQMYFFWPLFGPHTMWTQTFTSFNIVKNTVSAN